MPLTRTSVIPAQADFDLPGTCSGLSHRCPLPPAKLPEILMAHQTRFTPPSTASLRPPSAALATGSLLLSCLAVAASTGYPLASARWHAPAHVVSKPQSGDAAPALKLGKAFERELAGGEVHAYQLTLDAGQYARVGVEQRGVDVLLSLFGPDDRSLSEVDSPNGTQGPELISFVVAASGVYRLEVRSTEKKAPAGRYEVKLEELRAATPEDVSRVAAQQAQTEARRLVSQQSAESLRKAVEKYRGALDLWR